MPRMPARPGTRILLSALRRRLPRTPGAIAVDGLGDGPYVQLWPHRHGTDAMFAAALKVG